MASKTNEEVSDSSPLAVLRAAITAVPSMKYALALLGLLAVVAVGTTWGVAPSVALAGIPIMLVFMVGLVVFAALAKGSGAALRVPAVLMLWFFLIIMLAGTMFLFSAFFFQWPRPIHALFDVNARAVTDAMSDLDACLDQEKVIACSAPRKQARDASRALSGSQVAER